MKAIITVGCSASGKTTFAKELVSQGWMDVNRDDIRFEHYCGGIRDWSLYKFTKERENQVTQVQERMVDGVSTMGLNVIISDTNLNDKTRNFWINRLGSLGYEVEIKYFDVDLMELLARDAKRANGVGYKVITDQYAKYMKLRHGHEYHTYVSGRKHCVLIDLDGTVAQMNGRSPFDWHRVSEDLPRMHVIGMVEGYFWDTPYPVEVVFMSGRDAVCQAATRQWLIDNVGAWTEDCLLLMRPEGDTRKDTIVKKELFDTYIKGRYNVDYVIDDRPCVVRMWRYELGLETVCVSNPFIEF
jgi:predicted kinase